MSELDLNKLWNSDDKPQEHYRRVCDSVEALARKNSSNILKKIERKTKIEVYVSIFIIVAVGYYLFAFDSRTLYGYIPLIAVVSWFSFRLYFRLRKQIRVVNQSNVITALQSYIRIMNQYVKRSRFYVYIFTPLGFVVGLMMGMMQNEIPLELEAILIFAGTMLVVGVPMVLIMIWLFGKKYYGWMYQSHINQFQEVLNSLLDDESEA